MTFDHVITLTGGNDTIVVPGSSRDLIFGLGGRDTDRRPQRRLTASSAGTATTPLRAATATT